MMNRCSAPGQRLCSIAVLCCGWLGVGLAGTQLFGQLPLNDDPLAHVDRSGEPNPLIEETSPYLLMHAYNPVQWRAWNQETLELAKQQGKPIFLSIGYSSCHWCHVMERESFMDPEIAAFLNEHFICIKVDREERPDVDTIYMTSLSVYNRVARNGAGTGWPLSMFLTPDGKPFVGGTYFPARDGDRGATVGFLTLIERVEEVYREKTDKVQADADFLVRRVQQELDASSVNPDFEPGAEQVDRMVAAYQLDYDATWGGFGYSPTNDRIPKFPQPSNLFALLEVAVDWDNVAARAMLELTLEKMYLGGMHDHVGGGFHRYSVDRYWQIPHFEKMLYDNGQLASLYARASEDLGREDFARVARGICDFVLLEMTHPDGGFYSALDAESATNQVELEKRPDAENPSAGGGQEANVETEEGAYYVWQQSDLASLQAEQGSPFRNLFVTEQPNFEGSAYALRLEQPLETAAADLGLDADQLRRQLDAELQRLFKIRSQRPRPLTDTKILTSWNGLMIRGLADCGRILNEPRYVAAAERAARFVDSQLSEDDDCLARSWRNGQKRLAGYLDDYAFFIDGLLALHQATGDPDWLELALKYQQTQDRLFWDDQRGGYFFTAENQQSLLARARNPADNARPSGNSLAALNLIYLSQNIQEADRSQAFLDQARQTLRAFSGIVEGYPQAVPLLNVAASRLYRLDKSTEKR